MIRSNIKCVAITLTTMLQFGNAWFHLTLYWTCDYLSMLRLKLINLKIILTYVVLQVLLMGLQSPVVAKISFTYYSYRSTAHKMWPTAAVIHTFNRLCVEIIVGYNDRSRGWLWLRNCMSFVLVDRWGVNRGRIVNLEEYDVNYEILNIVD